MKGKAMASVVSSWYERSDGSGGVYRHQTTREWVDMSKLTDEEREKIERSIRNHNAMVELKRQREKMRERGNGRGLFGIRTSV